MLGILIERRRRRRRRRRRFTNRRHTIFKGLLTNV
jgi:hypothetical protein